MVENSADAETQATEKASPADFSFVRILMMLRIVEEGSLSHDFHRGAYMPSISRRAEGGYIACQHVGSQLASADNRIQVLTPISAGSSELTFFERFCRVFRGVFLLEC